MAHTGADCGCWLLSGLRVKCLSVADCLHERGVRGGPWSLLCPGHVMCCLQLHVMTLGTPERPGTVTTQYLDTGSWHTHQLLVDNPENYLLCRIIGLSWKALNKRPGSKATEGQPSNIHLLDRLDHSARNVFDVWNFSPIHSSRRQP